jgi:hypothetical protein
MAKCEWCNQEMMDLENVTTCTENIEVEFLDGTKMESVVYAPDYGEADHRCHDCNIMRGGKHHPGCDMERCPKCGGQLISCGCLD